MFAIGFGFDLSEFDIWWASERKNREKANTGRLHAYMISSEQNTAQSVMFSIMGMDERYIPVTDDKYEMGYKAVIEELKLAIKT